MAGRRPKPTAIKVLTGNPGKRPLNEREPQPTGVPTCPQFLNKIAKQEWRRIAKELKAMGLLTSVDRVALACYCMAWSRVVMAEQKIAETGMAYMTRGANGEPRNLVQSPYVGIANRGMEICHKFLTEFGLTPSSRSRVKVPVSLEQQSEWAELFEEETENSSADSKTIN
jgi:P27 family predicted phage terminase small subunit